MDSGRFHPRSPSPFESRASQSKSGTSIDLSGKQYGFRPIPPKIPVSVFEALRALVPEEADSQTREFQREIFFDNLLVQVHLIIEMSRPALHHGSLYSLFQVALYLPI